jgi:chlorite dismutase
VLANQFEKISAQAVIYQDLHDPHGIGVMAYCEDPGYIVDQIQPIYQGDALSKMEYREEFTMIGRTYSIGYEADLEDVLINRPIKRLCDPATPWAVYYPVRRSGQFEKQSREDQRKMLMEHGGIGHAYGKAGFATDIRLAGHGLNKEDNDFIVGLLGENLFPLSALVQHMRRTRQTSEFIQKMGPFFVGRAIWQPVYDPDANWV